MVWQKQTVDLAGIRDHPNNIVLRMLVHYPRCSFGTYDLYVTKMTPNIKTEDRT